MSRSKQHTPCHDQSNTRHVTIKATHAMSRSKVNQLTVHQINGMKRPCIRSSPKYRNYMDSEHFNLFLNKLQSLFKCISRGLDFKNYLKRALKYKMNVAFTFLQPTIKVLYMTTYLISNKGNLVLCSSKMSAKC